MKYPEKYFLLWSWPGTKIRVPNRGPKFTKASELQFDKGRACALHATALAVSLLLGQKVGFSLRNGFLEIKRLVTNSLNQRYCTSNPFAIRAQCS